MMAMVLAALLIIVVWGIIAIIGSFAVDVELRRALDEEDDYPGYIGLLLCGVLYWTCRDKWGFTEEEEIE